MLDDSLLTTLAMDSDAKAIAMTSVAAGAFICWILFTNMTKWIRDSEREKTKRDLAAYVAEGSISPDDAVRIANIGTDEFEEAIKAKLAAGVISPKKAEEMIRAACSAAKQEFNKA